MRDRVMAPPALGEKHEEPSVLDKRGEGRPSPSLGRRGPRPASLVVAWPSTIRLPRCDGEATDRVLNLEFALF